MFDSPLHWLWALGAGVVLGLFMRPLGILIGIAVLFGIALAGLGVAIALSIETLAWVFGLALMLMLPAGALVVLGALAGSAIRNAFHRRGEATSSSNVASPPRGEPATAAAPIADASFLRAGTRYRVIRPFADHDGHVHDVSESWTFLESAFVPYEDGMSWFVLDGGVRKQIRLRWSVGDQGAILDRPDSYLAAASSA